MSLANRLSQRPGLGPCRLGRIMVELSKKDHEALQSALGDPDVSTHRIYRVLREEGFVLSYSTVSRHRRGDCSCGTT